MPPDPEILSHKYLLDWFLRLSRKRAPAMSGLSPIGFQDIDAWARLTRENPEPWEILMIERMDDAFRAGIAEIKD